ncbi:hypothetical protein DM01DRAFT_1337311 [Hesseltinella vesiculosa]|uniref:Uncharacterized protein n=1 Tax=Hesseltinella vesiculosa TaxID=101127 RepID=A0A1X2GDG2_9FUNG|nr:hypothetical protein DM01DRAFT_1337311 [Hesseltinella vesiculosa]
MAVSNTPKAIIKGWTALSVLALGGYLFSKSYTNRRLQEYLAENGSVTSSGRSQVEEDTTNADGEKPLRRSVQRSL